MLSPSRAPGFPHHCGQLSVRPPPQPLPLLPSGSGGAPSPGAPVSCGLKDPEGLARAPPPLRILGAGPLSLWGPWAVIAFSVLSSVAFAFPVTSRPIPISVSEHREVWGSCWKGGVWEGLDR